MILKNKIQIDKIMLEGQKHTAEFIPYVTRHLERNLAERLLEEIEPGKDYLIKLHGAELYEERGTYMCGYKAALEVYGWTPCSKMMPAIGDFVLLSGVFEGVTKIIIAAGDQVRYWGNKMPGLAWMPLPEPYKEK